MVESYLTRLGLSDTPSPSLTSLNNLMSAHLRTVPFENLDVYYQHGVSVDVARSLSKLVDQRRGGWCFELNGAFGWLLSNLGFDVKLLGAAVLLSGPNRVVDHLTLEVTLDRPYLVDVGFGDGFVNALVLNTGDEQDGGSARFVFMPSAEGTTLVKINGTDLMPQYRFRRVAIQLDDLQAASDHLSQDPTSHFRQSPIITRMLDGAGDRVTLSQDRLRTDIGGQRTDVDLDQVGWDTALNEWFDIDADEVRAKAAGVKAPAVDLSEQGQAR